MSNTLSIIVTKFESVANGSVCYGFTAKEWEGYFAVSVEVKTDLEPNILALAESNLYNVSRKFFINLGKRYSMRVRDTAWTSRPYQPE